MGKCFEIAGRNDAAGQIGNSAYADRFAVHEGASTFLCPSKLTVCRRARDAEDKSALAHEGDLRRKEWGVADERLGAVNWVNQPNALGIQRVLTSLFAVKPVARETLRQHGPYGLFRAHVCLRHWRCVRLRRDLEVLLVHRTDDDGGRFRCITRRLELFGWHCLAISGKSWVRD